MTQSHATRKNFPLWIVVTLLFPLLIISPTVGRTATCSPDDWCLENPIGQGENLRGVWGSSASDVFAVGRDGSILHYDGSSWSTMDSGTTHVFDAVWGSGPNDVFVVGIRTVSPTEVAGVIMHYDGSNWSTILETSMELHGVWGSSGSDVFVAGYKGTILHYDGSSWSTMDSGTTVMGFERVWGSSGSDVFVVGHNGAIFHYNGSSWSQQDGGAFPGYHLYGVWGSSGTNVYASGWGYRQPEGTKGRLLHYDGSTWTELPYNDKSFSTIWGSSASDIFAVGSGRIIYHYNGTDWNEMAPGTGYDWLYGVWGSSNDDVFAVGQSGIILRYDGSSWMQTATSTSTTNNGVWGSDAAYVLSVGENGIILHSDGTTWQTMTSGTSSHLYGVWGSNNSDIFVVGNGGTVLHSSGSTWDTMTSGTSSHLYDVWGSSSSDIFAVGSDGTILHSDGTTWATMTSGITSGLDAVWGSSDSDVFAVGESGMILYYDGSTWSGMTSNTASHLYGAWGSNGNDVFAVGASGTILRYDGSSWSAMTSNTSNDLYSVWGSNVNDVFATGASGTILHYDGSNWAQLDSGYTDYLYGIWGSSGGGVLAVGSGGAILRRHVHLVSSSVDGGSGTISPSGDQYITHGRDAVFTLAPAANHHLDGMPTGTCPGGALVDNGNDTWEYTTSAITMGCTVTVNFAIDTYTVSAGIDSHGTLDVSFVVVDHGSSASFTVTPEDGYTTDSAVGGNCPAGSWSGGIYTTGTVTETCNVSFAHTINAYTVSAGVDSHGTLDALSDVVDHGSSTSFTVTPEDGYTTDSAVGGNCPAGSWNSGTYTTGVIIGDCSINFTHTINSYTVTSSVSSGDGGIDPLGDTMVNHGNTQEYSLTPGAGSHVDEVSSGCGGVLAGNIFTTDPIISSCSVSVAFNDKYNLSIVLIGGAGTVTSTPNGIDSCTANCNADFQDGSSVVLTAVATGLKGEFLGWSGGGCSGTDNCVVTMDQDHEVTARFKSDFSWNLFLPAIQEAARLN